MFRCQQPTCLCFAGLYMFVHCTKHAVEVQLSSEKIQRITRGESVFQLGSVHQGFPQNIQRRRRNPASTAPLPAACRCDMQLEHAPGFHIMERLHSHPPTAGRFQHPSGMGPFQEAFLRGYLAPMLATKGVLRRTDFSLQL